MSTGFLNPELQELAKYRSPDRPHTSCTSTSGTKSRLRALGEPVVIRAKSWNIYQTFLGSFAFWSGPLVTRQWAEDQQPSHQLRNSDDGSGFGAVLRLQAYGFRTSTSIAAVFRKWKNPQGTLSLQWNLSFPRIVPANADAFEFIRRGNLDAVRSIFAMGKGAPSDTTSDGTSLLHVRPVSSTQTLFSIDCPLSPPAKLRSGGREIWLARND